MMVRALLHGVSTVAGIVAMQIAHDAPMWMRMALYGGSWIACAAMYVPVLYVREHLVDAWDERTRGLLRDELDRRELLAYQRSMERERKRRDKSASDDRTER